MKKVYVLLAALVIAGVAVAATAQKNTSAKTQSKPKAEIIVVESDEYTAGKEDVLLTQGLGQFLEVEPVVVHVSVTQAANDPKLKGFDYSFLPLYLVKKTKAIRAKMEQPIQYGAAQETDEFIVLPHQTRQGVYNNKPAQAYGRKNLSFRPKRTVRSRKIKPSACAIL